MYKFQSKLRTVPAITECHSRETKRIPKDRSWFDKFIDFLSLLITWSYPEPEYWYIYTFDIRVDIPYYLSEYDCIMINGKEFTVLQILGSNSYIIYIKSDISYNNLTIDIGELVMKLYSRRAENG